MNHEIEKVKFHNDELAVLKHEGKRLVALKPIVENLGLDWGNNFKKVKADPVLSKGIVQITIPTKGGPQDMLFLELKLLAFYLAKINVNRVNKNSRLKLILYQTECAEVLHEHFLGHFPKGSTAILLGTVQQLKSEVAEITTRLDNTPIRSDGVKRAKLQGKIREYASVLGGTPKHYQQAYIEIRGEFRVQSFDDICLKDYQQAMELTQARIDQERRCQQMQIPLYTEGELN